MRSSLFCINQTNTISLMQFQPSDLAAIHREIAALRHECIRVERERHAFRHCLRDARHDGWDAELRDIDERKNVLVSQKAVILKQLSSSFVKECPTPL